MTPGTDQPVCGIRLDSTRAETWFHFCFLLLAVCPRVSALKTASRQYRTWPPGGAVAEVSAAAQLWRAKSPSEMVPGTAQAALLASWRADVCPQLLPPTDAGVCLCAGTVHNTDANLYDHLCLASHMQTDGDTVCLRVPQIQAAGIDLMLTFYHHEIRLNTN